MTILVIILVVILLAGYLLWLRGRFKATQVELIVSPTPKLEITVSPTVVATPSATATPSGKLKTSPTISPKLSPTKAGATGSGKTVR